MRCSRPRTPTHPLKVIKGCCSVVQEEPAVVVDADRDHRLAVAVHHLEQARGAAPCFNKRMLDGGATIVVLQFHQACEQANVNRFDRLVAAQAPNVASGCAVNNVWPRGEVQAQAGNDMVVVASMASFDQPSTHL